MIAKKKKNYVHDFKNPVINLGKRDKCHEVHVDTSSTWCVRLGAEGKVRYKDLSEGKDSVPGDPENEGGMKRKGKGHVSTGGGGEELSVVRKGSWGEVCGGGDRVETRVVGQTEGPEGTTPYHLRRGDVSSRRDEVGKKDRLHYSPVSREGGLFSTRLSGEASLVLSLQTISGEHVAIILRRQNGRLGKSRFVQFSKGMGTVCVRKHTLCCRRVLVLLGVSGGPWAQRVYFGPMTPLWVDKQVTPKRSSAALTPPSRRPGATRTTPTAGPGR